MKLRNEYPRPQMKRTNYINLNGEWDFKFLNNNELINDSSFEKKIIVPFAYEYPLSGINEANTHYDRMLYQRTFEINNEKDKKNYLLCFNGVDYECNVFINNKFVGSHKGGYTYFDFDISSYIVIGTSTITIEVIDKNDPEQVRGKQCWCKPFGCWYVPTSGIYKSVWIEEFKLDAIKTLLITPNIDDFSFGFSLDTYYNLATNANIKISYKGKLLKNIDFTLDNKNNKFIVYLNEENDVDSTMFWTPEQPNLFDIEIELYKDNDLLDKVITYSGMRKISIDNAGNICLNNKKYYQKLILQQGYYQDGGLTPKDIKEFENDILLMKKLGFNGARVHQKIEDPYFYYYADKLGFLIWLECPSAYEFSNKEITNQLNEWTTIVTQNYNFVSIVCYVPLNESWGVKKVVNDTKMQSYASALYYSTKCIDTTRLVSTNDGWEITMPTDIVGVHDYIKNGQEIIDKYSSYDINSIYPQGRKLIANGFTYNNQPILFTEFGGIAIEKEKKEDDWGYNKGATNGEDLKERIKDILSAIHKVNFQGYCYTQLSDVQQEVNGLCYIDRKLKFELKDGEILFY